MLRVSERTDRIHHIPRILYHWRAIPGSIAAGAEQKQGVAGAAGARRERAPGADRRRGAVAVPHPAIPHRAELAAPTGDAPGTGPGGVGERRDPVARRADRAVAAGRSLLDVLARAGRADRGRSGRRRVPERIAAVGRGRRRRRGTLQPLAGGEPGRRAGERRVAGLLLRRRRGRRARLARAPAALHAPARAWSRSGRCSPARTGAPRRPGSRSASTTRRCRCSPASTPRPTATTARWSAPATSRRSAATSSAFERAAFEAAGGFEENYATGYEDFDLCQRLRSLGGGVVYAARPRVVVHETAGLATRGARRRRPGAVRRPLVRGARARRPVLQPQLPPRPRRVRGRLMRRPRLEAPPGADAAGDRLLRPAERQQRDPGLSLRQRPHRGRLARHAGRRRRRPAGDPGGRRAELRLRHPPRPAGGARAVSARARAHRGARLDAARERARRDRELRPPGSACRTSSTSRTTSGTSTAPPSAARSTRCARLSIAEQDRISPDDADPPGAVGALHEPRRRDHGDHRGAQRVQPRRPPAPRCPPRDRLRALPPGPRAAAPARGARDRAGRVRDRLPRHRPLREPARDAEPLPRRSSCCSDAGARCGWSASARPSSAASTRARSGALREGVLELGSVGWREIPGYLALADAFVQPGAADDFNRYRLPSKLPEFLAMGRPVVLPDCNIGHDLVDGEQRAAAQRGRRPRDRRQGRAAARRPRAARPPRRGRPQVRPRGARLGAQLARPRPLPALRVHRRRRPGRRPPRWPPDGRLASDQLRPARARRRPAPDQGTDRRPRRPHDRRARARPTPRSTPWTTPSSGRCASSTRARATSTRSATGPCATSPTRPRPCPGSPRRAAT